MRTSDGVDEDKAAHGRRLLAGCLQRDASSKRMPDQGYLSCHAHLVHELRQPPGVPGQALLGTGQWCRGPNPGSAGAQTRAPCSTKRLSAAA